MLSSILSRIFGAAFILIILSGLGNIISQITLKPLEYKPSKFSRWTFGTPGLVFQASLSNLNEKSAPDTTIRYSFRNKSGQTGNGEYSLRGNDFYDFRKDINKLFKEKKDDELKLDSQITFIGELKWGSYNTSVSTIDSVNETTFVYKTSYSNEKHKKIKEVRDTFTNVHEAIFWGPYKTKNKISQVGFVQENLKILPVNLFQHLFFAIYEIIVIACFALFFLNLSWLFKNYNNQEYFTYENVKLLKRCGWLLLIPQISSVLFYWIFLFRIHPVKISYSYSDRKVTWLGQYDLQSEINWTLLFLGLGLLVVAYIFKNGLKLKEEQALTI
jgi:Protein of unknown function (DUF2975).